MLLKVVVVSLTVVFSTLGNTLEQKSNNESKIRDVGQRLSEVTNFRHDGETRTEIYHNNNNYDGNINELLANNNKNYAMTINHIGQKLHNNNNDDNNLSRTFMPDDTFDHVFDENGQHLKSKSLSTHLRSKGDVIETKRRRKRYDDESTMDCFISMEKHGIRYITHSHSPDAKTYKGNENCSIQINATSDDMVIVMTFIDLFGIEPHPDCAYDYLEIRDGLFGYSRLLGKVCGTAFPRQMTTSGPNAWLKFKSDEAIEYSGFKIKVEFAMGAGHRIPEACFMSKKVEYGEIGTALLHADCLSGSAGHALDVLWTLRTPEDTQIYLNFTKFELGEPNICKENIIEVFGSVLEENSRLAYFCGTKPNTVTTKREGDKKANLMYVRMFASKAARAKTKFAANFNAFRTLDAEKKEDCLPKEFNCEDNTCINRSLLCDRIVHCRLKTDEDERCDNVATSKFSKTHILIITIIFCLILSGMFFIFAFKFVRKLYNDHQIIKEQRKLACDDRLVKMGSRLTLDPKLLLNSEFQPTLDQENHANELFKKQNSFPAHRTASSNFLDQEALMGIEEEPWRRDFHTSTEQNDFKIEGSGRKRQNDTSRDKDSIRSRGKEKEKEEVAQEIESRDLSIVETDVKEFGCQTRDSLFLTDPAPSFTGSRARSTSRAVLSPTPFSSRLTIELVVPHEPALEKISESRPISSESTRSAPDVIIVSPT